MDRERTKRLLGHWTVCVLGVGLGVIFIYGAVFGSSPNLVDQYRLAESKSTAIGEITDSGEDYEPSDAGGGVHYWWAKVEFVTDRGDQVTTYVNGSAPSAVEPPVGRVQIRYLPDDPKIVLIDGIPLENGWKASKWPRSKAEFWQRNRLRVYGTIVVLIAILTAGIWSGVKRTRRVLDGLPDQE